MERKFEEYRSGEPCYHIGCINHITHPCEYCGRLGANGEAKVDITFRQKLIIVKDILLYKPAVYKLG